ncbi:hypothetical protein IRZ83_04990 [Flavobacterium sp. JLP]|uniref:hypothetical protein n=1 Tax=unclassified Flavobacterium TaxID=196869 RepID=UPI00188C08D7|nr:MULTISPECIES: hypothetical protein [unclassified Flavobacterium]MBF4491991.1 hypothetical protein [Flavobacterium sp. MR2016-29]MBF4506016.1 hypothetical protein [Flavobacterium sp. JLP]
MKKIIPLIAILAFYACSSSQNISENWIGKTKQSLIKNWGTPIRTLDNDKDGEILVYADQVYDGSDRNHNSRMAGTNYWNYRYIYVDKKGKVSSFRNEKQNYPPQAIDSNKMVDMKLLTSK